MAYKRSADHVRNATEWNRKNPDKHAEHVKKWEAKNPDKRRAYIKAWRERNIVSVRADAVLRARRTRWKQQGWTESQVEAAVIAQDGKCWLCGVSFDRGTKRGPASMCADHNHETGIRRGLLCHRCNVIESLILSTGLPPREWLTKLQLYLDTFDTPPPRE